MKEIQSLQSQSYEYLFGKIKDGSLVPGKVYSLNQMAGEAGLSRTPFRDAVMKLEQERMLDVLPSKGFVLHNMTDEDINETYQFREALELYCLKQLSRGLDTARGKEFLQKLEEKVDDQKRILESAEASAEEFGRKDYEFHRSMIQYVDNESMLETYRRFMYRIFRFTVTSFKREHRMEDTFEEHARMLQLLRQKDMNSLETLLEHHLNVAKTINMDILG